MGRGNLQVSRSFNAELTRANLVNALYAPADKLAFDMEI